MNSLFEKVQRKEEKEEQEKQQKAILKFLDAAVLMSFNKRLTINQLSAGVL